MTSHLVWLGFAVGLVAAVPLGPMGMVCVQRTLERGRLSGLVSASGLTVAAACWCVVAAHGLSVIARLVAGHETTLTVGLGLFLVTVAAIGLIRGSRRVEPGLISDYSSLTTQFVSSLVGVALNPVTFVTMTAALAILGGVRSDLSIRGMAGLAAAVFVGGMTVWVCLTQSIVMMRERLGDGGGACISKVLNYCILFLGLIYVVRPFLPDAMG